MLQDKPQKLGKKRRFYEPKKVAVASFIIYNFKNTLNYGYKTSSEIAHLLAVCKNGNAILGN
jgi:hypothetical protein